MTSKYVWLRQTIKARKGEGLFHFPVDQQSYEIPLINKGN
jgi:hypothetical protein